MRIRDWPLRVIQLLSVPGLLVSYYLFLYHEGYVSYACIADTIFDCSRVSGPTSPYASIGEFPVAALGLIGYTAIFLAIWLRPFWPLAARFEAEIVLGFTGLGMLFTLYLKGLELIVIHALCEYCLYSAILMLVMFVLAVYYFVMRGAADGEIDEEAV